MNVRVDLNYPIKDGTEVVFRSPVDCSQVTGLIVYYIGESGSTESKEFAFADAHGNNVGDIDHLFAENVAVKVILDVTTGMAFVQNADTNAYLEGRFASLPIEIIDKLCPAFTESGAVVTCEPVAGYPLTVTAEEGATITRCGKNLFGGEALSDKLVSKKGVKDTTNGTITFHPKNTGELLLFNKFKENTRYTIVLYGRSNDAASRYANIRISYTDGTSDANIKFTTPQNDEYVLKTSDASKTVSRIGVTYMGGETCLYYDRCGIFEGAVTANDFEAYVGGNFQQGEEIPAVQGVNSLWASSGEITVTGKADPVARLERLENAILAMGANV